MVLGLDISTSITGYTLVDGKDIVLSGAWDTRKYKETMSELTTNLASLNTVYGNMLSAMNVNG